jgi:hypothetical protein
MTVTQYPGEHGSRDFGDERVLGIGTIHIRGRGLVVAFDLDTIRESTRSADSDRASNLPWMEGSFGGGCYPQDPLGERLLLR